MRWASVGHYDIKPKPSIASSWERSYWWRRQRSHCFFRITHTGLGNKKIVEKGALTTYDLGVQVVPMISASGSGDQFLLDMSVGTGSGAVSASSVKLATWMSEPQVLFDDLRKSWKTWKLVAPADECNPIGKLWDIDRLNLEALGVPLDSRDSCLHLLKAFVKAKAFGLSQWESHVYVPEPEQDEPSHSHSALSILHACGIVTEVGVGYQLSGSFCAELSKMTVLPVNNPSLLFSSRPGIALESMSILELISVLEDRQWEKSETTKQTRKLSPYNGFTGTPKVYYVKPGTIPFKEYLLQLLTTSGKVFHAQCKAYYQCLAVDSDAMPHQPAQYYKAKMGRSERLAWEPGPRVNITLETDDGFTASASTATESGAAKAKVHKKKRTLAAIATSAKLSKAHARKGADTVADATVTANDPKNKSIDVEDEHDNHETDLEEDELLNLFFDDGGQGQDPEEKEEVISLASDSDIEIREPLEKSNLESEPSVTSVIEEPPPPTKKRKAVDQQPLNQNPDAVEFETPPMEAGQVHARPEPAAAAVMAPADLPPHPMPPAPAPAPGHTFDALPKFKNSEGHRLICRTLLPHLLQVLSDASWNSRDKRAQVREACRRTSA